MTFNKIGWLRLGSALLLLAVAGLAVREWGRFQAVQAILPPGSTVAGVPVGGLDRATVAQRLEAAYGLPVELRYARARIQLTPQAAGFSLQLEEMLPTDGIQGTWAAFLDYLWGRERPAVSRPLRYQIDSARLRAALEEIAARYDQLPQPARPAPARAELQPGAAGRALDIDAALPLVTAALPSLDQREVDLPIQALAPPRPRIENLPILLEQMLATSGFDSLADVYFQDLQTGQEYQFARRDGQALSLEGDIAFSASSIIKIPILISVFRRLEGSPDATADGWLSAMFSQSSNEAADAAMRFLIDEVRGPLVVTEDLQVMGFENTFLAGYFAPGSPLLQLYETPANRHAGIDTAPDMYNQTTPADIGRLLGAIYRCARTGDGLLIESFPDEMTPEKCSAMLEYMKKDREPYMLKAALPEATPAARKHGYFGSSAGVIQTIGDAAILFTPGGDYVLVAFLNNPDLLLFDPANALLARMSLAAYNFYNTP